MRRFLPLLCLVLVACGETRRPASAPAAHDRADSLLRPRHATRFGVAWRDGLAHAYVAAEGADSLLFSDRSFHYILLPAQRADAAEALAAAWPRAQVIPVPVRRAALVSTTHAALFEALDAREAVAGMAWSANLYDPALRARAADGTLRDLGRDADLDLEAVIDLQPDLVMTYLTADPAYGDYARLRDLGFPVLVNAEFREPTPLGQAEWMRLAGLLLDRARVADTLFAGVERRYAAWRDSAEARVAAFGRRPTGLSGLDWQGSWTVPRGGSFPAVYLRHAGADYLWRDVPGTGSFPVDVEVVLDRGAQADAWLHPGAARNLAELAAAEPRVRHLDAWRAGTVFNNDARRTPSGGNDYWESAVVRPDRVLRDLVRLFHARPGEDPPLTYYRRLPPS